jgi:chaperonin GroEL (HSP60 family)
MILTSDAATILRELEVVHPAAKLLVMASQQQEAEMGDATNLVIILAGELLKKAEELLRMGLKTSDIVLGYEKAQNAALQILEGMRHLSNTFVLRKEANKRARAGMRQGRRHPLPRRTQQSNPHRCCCQTIR